MKNEKLVAHQHRQLSTTLFADYLLPGPTEIPAIRIFHMETPSPYTEFGIKGMGEGGAIAPAPGGTTILVSRGLAGADDTLRGVGRGPTGAAGYPPAASFELVRF